MIWYVLVQDARAKIDIVVCVYMRCMSGRAKIDIVVCVYMRCTGTGC